MKPLLKFVLVGFTVILIVSPGTASLQPQIYCWTGDSEFPVACEEDEDEARPRRRLRLTGAGALQQPPLLRGQRPEHDGGVCRHVGGDGIGQSVAAVHEQGEDGSREHPCEPALMQGAEQHG